MQLETVQQANWDFRNSYEAITDYPGNFARDIAESVGEPDVLLQKIIEAMYPDDRAIPPDSRFTAVDKLLMAEVRRYASAQAEAAYQHRMSTPA